MSETVQRGVAFEPQGTGGYDQCWYPVASCSELAPGQVLGREFLSGKVVLYRTQDGVPHVLSAYCRHLGADLSLGAVIGDELRCPFHYWRYNSEGRCAHIPAGDKPPPNARLFKFPVAESIGLIWAFNGETALYPVPSFALADSELELTVWRNPTETPVDHNVFFLNAFDLQHFKAVHGMDIKLGPDDMTVGQYTIEQVFRTQTAELGPMVQHRKLWGTAGLTVSSMRGTRCLFMAHMTCALPHNRCQSYGIFATPKDGEGGAEGAQAALREAQTFGLRVIQEDLPIMRTLHFSQDQLTASDRLLAEGIRWVRAYPRANPAEALLR
jgi:phenylpropionate dioxygenase-like ring-hydroxylating dioxygenase large terminal subunit